ncbi:MAG: M60 family metallopeptidase [Cellulosilyticaceae bacterium]
MKKRIARLLLVSMLALQLQTPTFATPIATGESASLEVTLAVDYPIAQTKEGQMQLHLLQDGRVVRTLPLDGAATLQATALFEGLKLGDYTIRIEGEGYKTYESDVITLQTHEKHVVLGTSNNTFTSGDVNQDGSVDAYDQKLLQQYIDENQYAVSADLNRDGLVDIEDMAQIYWNQNATGDAQIYNTRLIMSQVANLEQIASELEGANDPDVTIKEGTVADLFDQNEQTALVFENTAGVISSETPVRIPISFNEEMKVSQINLTGGLEGAPTEGYIVYEFEGKTERIHFGEAASTPAPMAFGLGRSVRAPQKNTITINLGKQVPIQKITVEVTGTENGNHLASISKIEFLEDVVDDAVNQETGEIKGLQGKAKHKSVWLAWNHVPNITGYQVKYGTEPGQYSEVAYASSNNLTIEGLENFTPYYFVVQAINGSWQGPLSEEVMFVPAPEKKPGAPVEVKVEPGDQTLTVSFRNADEAVGSHVYYKAKNTSQYIKVADVMGSSHTLVGLQNGQTYEIYVTAYNEVGESAPSAVVEGTPVREELVIPKVPTHQQISREQITQIQLRDGANVEQSFYPEGFTPEYMIDKNYYTHWTAKTYQRARGIKVTFDQPYEMDYMAFVPRLDRDLLSNKGWYKDYPKWYGIRIWEAPGSEPKEIVASAKGSSVIPASGESGLWILPFPKSMVYQMEVILYEWDGAGNISIAEAMFYEYYDLVERIDQLFADDTYTTLAAGVSIEQIDAIENELDQLEGARLQVPEHILREELQIARALATTGTSTLLGEVIDVYQGRNPALEGDRQFANGRGLSGLQPTGLMAHADEEIIVYVDAPQGGDMPKLVASQFYGDGGWRKDIALKPGRNVVKVPRVVNYNTTKGGPLYLEYTGADQGQTRVHIRKGTDMPTLELLDLDDTAQMTAHKNIIRAYIEELDARVDQLVAITPKVDLAKDPRNSTEIGTAKVLLSVPANGILESIQAGLEGDLEAQVERVYEALLTWEANMANHYEVLGLTPDHPESRHRWPDTRMNIRYMPMSSSAFMYAAADHVGIRYGSEKGLINETRASQTGYFGWGINHEIGHILNTNEYIYGEISNNIFALFAQIVNDGRTRLEENNIYEEIYTKVVSEDTGLSSNVFVTLGMFWQLHLAYDDVDGFTGIDGFYPRLNRLFREDTTSEVDKHNMLARLASDVVGKDLTPFFEKWDLPITEETKAYTSKYDAESRPIYYLTDEAKRYQLSGGAQVDYGNLAITATSSVVQDAASDDQEVAVTISHDQMPLDREQRSALLGYEIYRNGELIAFTTEATYRDALPASNNVSYAYEVVVYDKLLGHSERIPAGSVHIAREGILDHSDFVVERTTPGMIQIDMRSTQQAVGIKLGEVTTSGAYMIEVSEDGSHWTQAKVGTLEDSQSILYFNKPGVEADDQRIWTYDARYIRLSGEAVETLETSAIQVIGYPGDAVYFTEGAIGRLGHDYAYDGGVIEEGSLVVLGTYRGHPIYSKIVLSAKYVNDKGYDLSEKPDYVYDEVVQAINGEVFLFAELPEDGEVSKVNNGIWLFVPQSQTLPAQIKANMYRTNEAGSIEGGRLVSDTPWIGVPDLESLPTIYLN